MSLALTGFRVSPAVCAAMPQIETSACARDRSRMCACCECAYVCSCYVYATNAPMRLRSLSTAGIACGLRHPGKCLLTGVAVMGGQSMDYRTSAPKQVQCIAAALRHCGGGHGCVS